MVVRETYKPDFWKIAFSSKIEHVSSDAYEFTAVSVNVKHIDSMAYTTEPESTSFSRAAGYWSCCFMNDMRLICYSPIRVAEYCDQHICVSVCSRVLKTTCANFTKFSFTC